MTRVAVVTGGSAGLGRATVRELAARGWDVAVLARGQEGVDAAAAEVEAAGRRGWPSPSTCPTVRPSRPLPTGSSGSSDRSTCG
ncbi:SDR family NAD(P)-dependent oxidoreductase [Curtobacterium poinsettiae]|uniref:SDR family NAD(P)-dependent oxidoreductase n=1 Tax=Curtobacterium poinsettiae TaxID=159612 RepID=A0A9Q9T3V8_9MICO|nr:SDR family NAD(P)-dependent oxidoreductase [Curtobacterium flaccumfaciens]UYC81533.1 SDR family NAD(P)-dependent oxidoreductase [Curtobacterium flaccumfaciens pv. poinsettiae]